MVFGVTLEHMRSEIISFGIIATCSAAQQHSIFTVQILYKLYILQLNCTYSNYTEAAAACSAAQQHIYCTNTVQTVHSTTELYLQ